MQVPIPDDWNGLDWSCVQIQWPDSPKWFALLAGLITQPSRGRWYNANTGSIIGAQLIGALIDERNIPFTACSGDRPTETIIDTQYLYQLLESEESDFIMTLCGYNPKAFRIQDGVFQVRDFCGDWVTIGAIGSAVTPDLPGPDDLPDPLPPELNSSTACAMARKLAQFVYNIVARAWVQIGTPELIDLPDFVSDMRDYFPGVDLSYNSLISLYLNIIPLDASGYENECLDPTFVDYMACYYVDKITARDTGITESEYNACVDATEACFKHAVGDSSLYGFGLQIRAVYEDAIESIGPKDAQKITYLAQPVAGEDCQCPDALMAETDPTTSGWYWSEMQPEVSFPCPDDPSGGFPYDEWAYAFNRYDAPHDVYGVKWQLDVNTGPINAIKRSNDPAPGVTYDHYFMNSNSDSLAGGTLYVQCGPNAFAELYPSGGPTRLGDGGGDFSDTVASPVATVGQLCLMTISAHLTAGQTGGVTLKNVQWLHNSNSPSHS